MVHQDIPARIRALIYDFDDTIVESERVNDAMFSDLLRAEYGIDLSAREQEELYGYSWSGVFTWLRENRGLHHDKEAVWARFMEIKREFLGRTRLRVATGFERMLTLPVPQAIVSGSTREEITMMLANIGMAAESVQFILCDEDGGAGKPHPEGFLNALERLKVPPRETLVFEDSPAGIEAAHRAGIPVAFVAEMASRDNADQADLSFESFLDAWQWVKGRIG